MITAKHSLAPSQRRQVTAWMIAAGAYGAAQGLSAQISQRMRAAKTRSQYQEELDRPAFAPPGAVFPVVWSVLNLTTATSAWRVWRARVSAGSASERPDALAWWALAVAVRSGYVPLAFGRRRLWAATADSAALTVVMLGYALRASRDDQLAAALAVPEIAWTAFATILSAAIARRNP